MPTSLAAKSPYGSLPAWIKGDVYWRSALHILISLGEREAKFQFLSERFVNLDDSTMDFFAMKQAVSSWSHGEKIMVDLAAHLFNEVHEFNLSDLDYLDRTNSQIALKGIEARYKK